MNSCHPALRRDRFPPRERAAAGCTFGCAALFALAGCATVHIEGDDGEVRVERHFGLLSVRLQPQRRSLLAETTALGVVNAWDGFTLGYYDASLVALSGNDCRIVLWAQSLGQVSELRRLLDGRGDVCVFDEGADVR